MKRRGTVSGKIMLIGLGVIVVAIAAALFYFASVADKRAGEPTEQRLEVDNVL